jgi:hypothetical protein
MPRNVPHLEFRGRLVLLGFGSIRQAVLPLLFRHLALRPERVTVIKAGQHNADKVRRHGMRLLVQPLTADKYQSLLTPCWSPAPDFGRLGSNIYYLRGFSGHGQALADMAGKLAAEAIAGQAERFDLRPDPGTADFPAVRWRARPRWCWACCTTGSRTCCSQGPNRPVSRALPTTSEPYFASNASSVHASSVSILTLSFVANTANRYVCSPSGGQGPS